MAAAPAAGGGRAGALPRLSIGLLQSEAEMLHVPGQDWTSFFTDAPDDWRVDVYTERQVRALLDAGAGYDCIVLGYNAIRQSQAIRQALGETQLSTGVLVLHQLDRDALSFLPGELAVAIEPLERAGPGRVCAVRRHTSDPADALGEVILSWPKQVALQEAGAPQWGRAECWLAPGQGTVWRTVVELERAGVRRPVVLRTAITHVPGVVVCTLLLEQTNPEHIDLLKNMVVFCSLGQPEVAVVGDPADPHDASILTRKLRLQRVRAVEVETPAFAEWPMRATREVILLGRHDQASVAAYPGGEAWLAAGGTIVTVEDGSRPVLHPGESDADWVVERWATWFRSAPSQAWQGSLLKSRAVLRVLAELRDEGSPVNPDRLGLPPPAAYHDEVKALIRARLAGGDNCEGTISATAAAYDLNRLVGGDALPGRQQQRVAAWLAKHHPAGHDADRLDIARCLVDRELLALSTERLRGVALTPLLMALLCEAAVACGFDVDLSAGVLSEGSESSLDTALILSARYLAATAKYAKTHEGSALVDMSGDTVDRAVATIRQFGSLARLGGPGAPPPESIDAESVSTQALALLAYFRLSQVSTAAIVHARGYLPGRAIESLLRESAQLRGELRDETERAARVRRQAEALRHLLGVLALVVAIACGYALDLVDTNLEFSVVIAIGIFVSLYGLLSRLNSAPGWLGALVKGARDILPS